MSDEQRYSEDEGKEKRDEGLKDLDVSEEDSENVTGGALRQPPTEKK